MATHQFLREVAKEYSIPYDELKSRVSEVCPCEQLENLDDADDLFDGTKHFNRFVRQHDVKKVDICTVAFYLKDINSRIHSLDLSHELTDTNTRMVFMKDVLFATSLALGGLLIFV